MIAPAFMPVFAVLVAAPAGPDDACPSARQVTEAMQARFPASLLSSEQAASQARLDVLRALLDVAGDGTVVRFSLIDAHGDTQLRRTLPAPGHGRPVGDCLALADTLAAIVERYLGFIAYESSEADVPSAPASQGPPAAVVTRPPVAPAAATQPVRPRTVLGMLGAGWRMPSEGNGEPEGLVGAQMDLLRSTPRVAASLSLGAAPGADGHVASSNTTRAATLRRFPIRLGALLELPTGPGLVEPALQIGTDLLAVSGSNPSGGTPSSFLRFGTGFELEAAVGYRLPISRLLYVRPKATIGLAVIRYDILADGMSIFRTPRAYATFGIDTGVVFQ